MNRFALYARTSTDDLQDPADSLRWQRDTAARLTAPHGEIVAVYHDIDRSRSLPWERRPEATRILSDVRNPSRGWDSLVIAEPQRAFSGAQFDGVANVLSHFGVALWVPELGGAFDPDNDGHWLTMAAYGTLSRAERNRTRVRVRNAMRAHAQAGRWLGGRPPYGYRLADAGPHPNPEKAASGARPHRLEPDPESSAVVQRIFAMYLAGAGFKAIASTLTAEGVPSPSAADPARNRHRPGHAWAFSAVRAILTNPRYLGRQVYGRQAKAEQLLDPDYPALGHVTRQRWQNSEGWVYSTETTHQPLVDEIIWSRAQQVLTSTSRSPAPTPSGRAGRARATSSRYPLVGILTCDHCVRKMQGQQLRSHQLYRCRTGIGYPTAPMGHPANLYVREDRLLPHLDAWLVGLFVPSRVEEVARAVVQADALSKREDPAVSRARAAVTDCQHKLERHLAALEAGMDPGLIVARTAEVKRQLAAAEAVVAGAPAPPTPLSIEQVADTLATLYEVPPLLDGADPADRGELYRALGVALAYRRSGDLEEVRLQVSIGVGGKRVGGGTRALSPHLELTGERTIPAA